MRRLPPEIIERITEMLRDGISTRKISRKVKVSQSSVMNVRRAENLSRVKVKHGRPCLVSDSDARMIGRTLNTGKAKTPREAAEMAGVNVSVWTVRRALKRVGCMITRTTKHKRIRVNTTAQLKPAPKRQNLKVDEWLLGFSSRESETSGTKSDAKSSKSKKLRIKVKS